MSGKSNVLAAISVVGLVVVSVWAFRPPAALDAGDVQTRVAPLEVYDPVAAGERLPDGFRQLLPRDGIRPVYDPEFVSASSVDWPEEAHVIGVSAEGEAKAYPVSYLNRREMVNDFIAGDPILVTW